MGNWLGDNISGIGARIRGTREHWTPLQASADGSLYVIPVGSSESDSPSQVALVDGSGDLLAVDRVTTGLQGISTDHAQIHAGNGYSIYATFDAVPDANTRNVVITTNAATYMHLKFYDVWISNAKGLLQLYENPQSAAGGSSITPSNRRRIPTVPTSGTAAVHTATLNLTGAILLETLRFGGGGTGPQGRAGGDRSLDVEWVLARGETYVFYITNQSGGAADIGFWAFWYEESAG